MADDPPPRDRRSVDDYASGANLAWSALGYLLAGMLVWGLVGWLFDRWLHLGGVATAIGAIVGVAGGVLLIVIRIGK